MLYRIPKFTGDKLTSWCTVEATEVTFPGFTEFGFIVHKSVNVAGEWTVSEKSTGFSVASGNTWDEVSATAFDKLHRTGADKIKSGIETAKKMIDASPLGVI